MFVVKLFRLNLLFTYFTFYFQLKTDYRFPHTSLDVPKEIEETLIEIPFQERQHEC